jgi:predicted MFS family arabinose efflux permease
MTENMPAGLLPQIGHGLSVSEAMTGQTVTLYALGSVVAAIPVIAATRSWNRRPLFLLAIAGLLIFNTLRRAGHGSVRRGLVAMDRAASHPPCLGGGVAG